jgi:DNA polymerase-3 subunit alpha
MIKYAIDKQQDKDSGQISLFDAVGSGLGNVSVMEPRPPKVAEWSHLERLNREKEIVGFYLSGHPLDDFKEELKRVKTTIAGLEDYKDERGISIAGMVTSYTQRLTQKGEPFVNFTVEDKTGALQLTLWKKSIRLHNIPQVGTNVYIIGDYQIPPYRNTAQYEFQVTDIIYLSELLDRRCRGVKISLPINKLSTELLQSIQGILTSHEGKKPYFVEVNRFEDEMKLDFTSRDTGVSLSNKLLQDLELLGIDAKLLDN